MRSLLLGIGCFVALAGHGQVYIDHAIQLTGTDGADRQVTGLAPLTDPSTALSVEAERRAMLVHAQAGAAPVWSVDIPALSGVPLTGTHITVRVPDNATGPVSLLLNGVGPFDVVTGPGAVLEGTLVPSGSILSLVFTGTAFQLMNGETRTLRTCPNGLVAVNGQFCIELQQDTAVVDFFAAATDCGTRGLRLCSWAEFHVACVKRTMLGINDIIGDYEWVGSACNENGSARIAGSSSCTATACALAFGSTDRPYRCCADR
ncbi:MAG: hypothetical protein ABI432_12510 [Flavobacteriales bacterium]